MPSITDVLNEKYGTSGSNIAEAISQAEKGSGGGGNGDIVVVEEIIDYVDGLPNVHLTKTAGELEESLKAGKNLMLRIHAMNQFEGSGEPGEGEGEAGVIYTHVMYTSSCAVQFGYDSDPAGALPWEGVITFYLVGGIFQYHFSSLDEYPYRDETNGGGK